MISIFLFIFFVAVKSGDDEVFVHMTTVKIAAFDGTLLNTLIFTPWDILHPDEKLPTLLYRTPYGASGMKKLAESRVRKTNVAVVVQDIRGCHDSEGLFVYFHSSAEDAASTVGWLQKQKWWDGTLLTAGGSAVAMSQYVDPFTLSGMNISGQCLTVGTGYDYQFAFQNGAWKEGLMTGWITDVVGKAHAPEVLGILLKNEAMGSGFWKPVQLPGFYQNVNWPSIHIGAWYDIFDTLTINSFKLYREANPHAYLVMGAAGHCEGRSAINFPNESFIYADDYCNLLFDPILKKETLPGSFVTLYIMGPDSLPYGSSGGNFWVGFDDFPDVFPAKFYLASNGTLPTVPETSQSTATFAYDPSDPTPTIAGNNLILKCGAQDLRTIENRTDNLIFDSEVFKEQVAILGEVHATLWVSSDRNDTDFVVRLSDVYPDGRSMYLRSGVVRMRWRNGYESPDLMIPNKMYEIKVDMWAIGYIVNPGHRIRVAVTSSNFPRYSANRNNGLNVISGGDALVAANTVSYGGVSVSNLELPLVSLSVLNSHRI